MPNRQPPPSEKVLTKEAYFRECFLRNEAFHAEFRSFCERYPLVWLVRDRAGRSKLQRLLARLGTAVEIETPRPDCTIVRLPDFLAHRAHAALVGNPYEIKGSLEAVPPDGWYFELIGSAEKEPATQLFELVRTMSARWPMYRGWRYAGALVLSEMIGRPEIVRSETIFRFGSAFAGVLARHAGVWVPIYPDTGPDDLSWKRIQRVKREVYGTERRMRLGSLASRLKVFDIVRRGGTISDAAALLKMPRRSVRDAYSAVARDIASTSSAFPVAIDEDRQDPALRAFDLQGHVRTCALCQKPAGDRYCKVMKRYLTTLERASAAAG